MNINKKEVYDFWNQDSCGERFLVDADSKSAYAKQSEVRYKLEPYISSFAAFNEYKNQDVLEIGVGLGADHQRFAEGGAKLSGIDLTHRAIEHVKNRMQLFDCNSNLQVADAENLPYKSSTFDLVYSWGVLHHSPNTQQAVDEVCRVLKENGQAKIMIYHKYSFVGYMLWLKYALLKFKPFTSLHSIYAKYLESPGTKAYSSAEAYKLFSSFSDVSVSVVLTHGDLLTSSAVGARHQGLLLSLARLMWPRWLIKTFFSKHGLFMLVTARK